MKKVISLLMSFVMLLSVTAGVDLSVYAANATSGKCGDSAYWNYDEDTKTLTISGSGRMDNYFRSTETAGFVLDTPWVKFRRNIKKISIGNNVTSIGDEAFYNCIALTSVTIGNSVTSIGKGAFDCCSSLTNITIPNGVTNIGEDAFNVCSNLTSVTIPNSVTSIDKSTFSNCKSLISVTIPNSVTSIGDTAFYQCDSLTNVIIPDSVISIGAYAFGCSVYMGSSNLTSVTIGNSVTSIGNGAFYNCSSLTSVTIPNSVTSIGTYAFYSCDVLTSVTIGNSVTSIGDHAFDFCDGLTNVVIPDSVTSIGDYAFYSCDGLTSAIIGKSVTSIGLCAFSGCSSLTSVIILSSETIPNSVTSIGVRAFENCSSLTSITIPNSVTIIKDYAFNNCNKITDVYYSGTQEQWEKITIENYNNSNQFLLQATIHYNSTLPDDIKYGVDSENFGNDITGCVGDEIKTLLVYTSEKGNISSLKITSSDSSVVEVGDVQYGVGDYTTGTNEQKATVLLKLKGEGEATVTVTSTDGISKNVNVIVSKVVDKSIAIFTTEKSLNIEAGKSMSLAFGLIDNNTGSIDKEWKKMAVTVSDSTVISLSDYKKSSEYGFYIDVFGKKQGSTNVIITDTETGANTSFVVNVYKTFDKTYSYAVDNMSVFYPNNKFENHIATNIYNLNGIYVNNYQYTENNGTYYVEFDAYNSRYYAGAVDIYDENGMWLGYEEIEKYSNISSIRDVLDQTFYLISNTAAIIGGKRGNLLTYEQESFAKHTHVKINVPKNGYFTISNNMASSPGTYFVNAFEILFDATTKLLDLAMSNDVKVSALHNFKKNASKTFASHLIEARNEALKDEIKKNAQLIKLSAMQSEIEKITKNFSKNELKDKISATNEMYSSMATYAENIIQSFGFGDNWWKKIYASATGVAESVFTKFAGPAGVALKGCFEINKLSDKLLMGIQMSSSTDKPCITVYSKVKEDYNNSYGITVDGNGNVNKEAVLQVFRISNTDVVETLLDNDNPLEKHELYNICFVKDDKLVQPNGKVTVYVPIPTGMNGNTCKIYRQETDGSWTILDARIKGNYLVFETDHFSLYSVIGDMIPLTVNSMPNKVNYFEGETLNTDGLVLELNGDKISEGFICDPVVLSGAGEHTITVSYGNTFTQFNVNVLNSCEHSFKDYKYNNDATCTADGTQTATCEYGCGTQNTITAPNTAIGHKFVDNEKYCTNGCKTPNPNYKGSTSGGGSTGGGGGGTPAPAPTTDETKKDDEKQSETKPNQTQNTSTSATQKLSIKKLVSKKKALAVYWNKIANVSGYQIQVATDKKFKKNKKTVTVAKQNASKRTVKKLKSKKKYYVRVRSYKIVNGKKSYGKWSKVKFFKTK